MEILVNNLKFKSVQYQLSMGKLYAFVTTEDLGSSGKGFTPSHYKHYWGEVSEHNNKEDIQAVMESGGKWGNLPKTD